MLRFRLAASIALVLFGVVASAQCWAAEKPNVLFIAVDDLRCELGCYGVDAIHTPNMDRLAASGVRFERAYCQLAVCNPSRVSVMTGLRPDSTKVWDLKTEFRNTIPDAVTIPQHFRKHGYYAASFGKIFHNPWPDQVSWSEPHSWPEKGMLWSEGSRNRLAEYRKQMKADGKSAAKIKRMRAPAIEMLDIEDSEHKDGAIADQAIEAMQRLSQAGEPFFLAAGFVRPHLPFVVPTKYWEMYDREKIQVASNPFFPENMPEIAFSKGPEGGFYELRDYLDFADAPSPFERTMDEDRQRELKHGYYAAVSFIDAQVGRLLDSLEQLGLEEDTVVVLWSDHGWKLGEHRGWCKQTNFEIDTRVPLFIRDPRAKSNGESIAALVELIDLYPTLCELSDIPIPDFVEGKSLVPLLNDPSQSVKDFAISQFPHRENGREFMGYALRTDRFRYVVWLDEQSGEVGARELYDHSVDPEENKNLAVQNEFAEQIKSLEQLLWSSIEKPSPKPGS